MLMEPSLYKQLPTKMWSIDVLSELECRISWSTYSKMRLLRGRDKKGILNLSCQLARSSNNLLHVGKMINSYYRIWLLLWEFTFLEGPIQCKLEDRGMRYVWSMTTTWTFESRWMEFNRIFRDWPCVFYLGFM